MKLYSLLVIGLILSNSLFANLSDFKKLESELVKFKSIVDSSVQDVDKIRNNERFIIEFEKVLKMENSFQYSFDSLKTIGKIKSDDEKIKIYTWNVALRDGSHIYHGFIQSAPDKQNISKLYKLTDDSQNITHPFNQVCNTNNWYGALYYKVIKTKAKGQEYYTLLGWDGNSYLSTKKVVEILYFDDKGTPKFGHKVFDVENANPVRIIFEYSNEVSMSLKYEKQFLKEGKKKKWMIVFDHLSPKSETLKGQYKFYGPDFTYDGMVWKGGKWKYYQNVDARNQGDDITPNRKRMSDLLEEDKSKVLEKKK